jgi:hypothetical protein
LRLWYLNVLYKENFMGLHNLFDQLSRAEIPTNASNDGVILKLPGTTGAIFAWGVASELGSTAGVYAPGCILVDVSQAKVYVNTNTAADPTWTACGSVT